MSKCSLWDHDSNKNSDETSKKTKYYESGKLSDMFASQPLSGSNVVDMGEGL